MDVEGAFYEDEVRGTGERSQGHGEGVFVVILTQEVTGVYRIVGSRIVGQRSPRGKMYESNDIWIRHVGDCHLHRPSVYRYGIPCCRVL